MSLFRNNFVEHAKYYVLQELGAIFSLACEEKKLLKRNWLIGHNKFLNKDIHMHCKVIYKTVNKIICCSLHYLCILVSHV